MKKEDWAAGFKAVLPICISYIPIGIACGIVLQQAGYHPLIVALSSLLIYGGASQFMIASMTIGGAGLLEIILMVFFINMRHFLMSSSLANRVKEESSLFHFLFAQTVTDEMFAINTLNFRKAEDWTPQKGLAAGMLAYGTWGISTVIGAAAGNRLAVSTVVMNYLLTALFLYLLVSQIDNRIIFWTAAAAVILAVVLMILLQNSIAVLFASMFASLFGLFLESLKERKEGTVYES